MLYKIFLLTGFLLLLISLYQLKESIDFIRRSEQCTGTVTSLQVSDGAYSPVFTLRMKDNTEVVYHHAAATHPSAWDVGETAVFLYDPANPGSPRMMRYFWIFNWSLLFMAAAVPLLIFGAGYYLLRPVIYRVGDDGILFQPKQSR